MAWGKEWSNDWTSERQKELKASKDKFDVVKQNDINSIWDGPKEINKEDAALFGIDLGTADTTAYGLFKDGKYEQISEAEFNKLKEYNNKVPTHDPYTNPNAHIYYECSCGAILDPGTKSFAQLNNHAMNAGWKIRWGAEHYVPYCVKCGEEVE